jgi:hypothetical protein
MTLAQATQRLSSVSAVRGSGAAREPGRVEGPARRIYNRGMRHAMDVFLIVGFLVVDFLFFHDVFKAGEVTTPAQYLTGFLSILVIAVCGQSLMKSTRH